jgi:hypothetical protein
MDKNKLNTIYGRLLIDKLNDTKKKLTKNKR